MSQNHPPAVRWGILGAAQIARTRLLPAIAQSSLGYAFGIASRNPEHAREMASTFQIERVFPDYLSLIESPDIDAVYIPLPISEHRIWAEHCARAGKPTLVEKSLAPCPADAIAIRDFFSDRGVLVAEALMYRFHPLIRRVKAIVDEGTLGAVQLIRSNFEVNIPRDDIRYRKDLGGGAMLDLGCYNVSIARYLTGEEPIRACGFGQFGEVDEVFAGLLQFPSGAISHLGCSLRGQMDCSFEVVGEKGRLIVERGGMIVWPGDRFHIHMQLGNETRDEPFPPSDHYLLMIDDFSRKVRDGVVDPHSLDDAIANLKAIQMLLDSAPHP